MALLTTRCPSPWLPVSVGRGLGASASALVLRRLHQARAIWRRPGTLGGETTSVSAGVQGAGSASPGTSWANTKLESLVVLRVCRLPPSEFGHRSCLCPNAVLIISMPSTFEGGDGAAASFRGGRRLELASGGASSVSAIPGGVGGEAARKASLASPERTMCCRSWH